MGKTPRHMSSNRSMDGTYMLENLPEFHRVIVTPTLAGHKPSDAAHRDVKPVAEKLLKALEMRQQYLWQRTTHQNEDPKLAKFEQEARRDPFTHRVAEPGIDEHFDFCIGATGVAEVTRNGNVVNEWAPPSLAAFTEDLTWLYKDVCCGKAESTFAFKRLKMLEKNFLYSQEMNWSYEAEEIRFSRSDFSKVVKVDTHIHAASAFTRCELLEFMHAKLRDPVESKRVVATADDKKGGLRELTLTEVLTNSGLNADKEQMYKQLTIDRLNVAASAAMFHRFDNFNDSYNPMANPNLRSIFMKTGNKIGGQYFAELLHVVFDRLRSAKHDGARCRIEPRLSIYGRSDKEWDELARWFVSNKMLSLDPKDGSSDDRVRWAIQIPRLYQVFCGKPLTSFGHLLRNIFNPLFEVTIDPSSHPDLHLFLMHVGFFDCVDDESVLDDLTLHDSEKFSPDKYSKANGCTTNPPYSYFLYHLYANLKVLNHLREAKGFNTFPLKPHAGEAGSRHHMATAFLLADSVNHGIKLQENPTLQYLFYLAQIGLAMCPVSNNALFLKLDKSPIGTMFRQGLNISFGTDDPLQFHQSTDPLLEEYTIAAKAWELTNLDLCEIACMSVKMSGFPARCKAAWIGDQYYNPMPTLANDLDKTNVATSRAMFRSENLRRELTLLAQRTGQQGTVRVGQHVVNLDIEREVHKQTRKLHDIYNTLYYGVEMRRDDPPDTWTGTPRGQGNSRWAGGDGLIENDPDAAMHTPKTRQLVKQTPPPELTLPSTVSAKQIPAAVAVSTGARGDVLAVENGVESDCQAKTFMAGCLVGIATVLGSLPILFQSTIYDRFRPNSLVHMFN